MFQQCLEKVDANATRELASFGVPAARVTDWRKGRRLPTRSQALALAHVTEGNFDELERELSALEAAKDAEKNRGVARLIAQLQGAGQILYLSTISTPWRVVGQWVSFTQHGRARHAIRNTKPAR